MRTVPGWVSFVLLVSISVCAQEAPAITSPLLANATTGQFFNYTISATGTTPITFVATPLPSGLTQTGNTISGTPTTAGTTNVQLTASNGVGSDSRTLVIVVTDPLEAPNITSPTTAATQVGRNFTYLITATGTQPIRFSALPLPPGLSLVDSTITGTPTQAGIFNINLNANNIAGSDDENLLLTVNESRELQEAPVFTMPLTATTAVGANFRLALTASGTQPITFTAENLPEGFSFDGTTISGTPTKTGTFNIPLGASNAIGVAAETLALTVTPPGGADISGAWTGKARSSVFKLSGGKNSKTTRTLNANFTHSGNTLTATLVFTGNGALEFTANGQIGNGNFWLAGTTADATQSLVVSGHVNKKGSSITGSGFIYGAMNFEELKFTLKK
jgi:hypothetical protein